MCWVMLDMNEKIVHSLAFVTAVIWTYNSEITEKSEALRQARRQLNYLFFYIEK